MEANTFAAISPVSILMFFLNLIVGILIFYAIYKFLKSRK